jgi:dolichol-phosphate mannosyltransferase
MVVVLPTYNEAENVLDVTGKILASSETCHVLVVDDASPDGTSELVATARRQEPRIHLLRRRGKLGLGSAYLAGFAWALERDYAVIATMDCDHSHDPGDLPRLEAALGEDGIVIGSRYVPGGRIANWPLHRRLLSRFANAYTRVLLRLPVHDCTSGYRCYTRSVLEAVDPLRHPGLGLRLPGGDGSSGPPSRLSNRRGAHRLRGAAPWNLEDQPRRDLAGCLRPKRYFAASVSSP